MRYVINDTIMAIKRMFYIMSCFNRCSKYWEAKKRMEINIHLQLSSDIWKGVLMGACHLFPVPLAASLLENGGGWKTKEKSKI